MQVSRATGGFPAPGLRRLAVAVFAALALWLLVSPQPAQANVGCSVNPNPASLNFGSALTTTGTVGYSCQNFGPGPSTFTLCLGVGTSSFPGTPAQPKLQSGGNALNYNIYTDSGFNTVWTTTNPITRSVTVPANQTATGSFTYYGKIPSGQAVPTGSYSGQLFNTRLGFFSAGACRANATDSVGQALNGQDVTINVAASLVPSCTLGTISAINFGTSAGLRNTIDATGAVQLVCPVSLPWTLKLGGGGNASGGVRRMKNPAGNFVPYRIFSNSGRTAVIAIDGTLTGTGNGATQTATIYGRVDPAAPPALGLYQDTIVVTLSF